MTSRRPENSCHPIARYPSSAFGTFSPPKARGEKALDAKESLKKCEKCRLEPARPILPRPTPRFLHVELMASTFAAAVAREEQTRHPLAAILVSRATCPFTVGHHPCPTGTPPMSHWYTGHVPLVHRPCTTGTPAMSHWYTAHVPLGHRPCPTGTPTMYHWDIDHVPLGHPPCPTGATHVVPRYILGAHVRAHRVTRFFLYVPASPPLTSRFNGLISFATTSNFVRFSALAAVGGTGVLNKHIRPVPARELS